MQDGIKTACNDILRDLFLPIVKQFKRRAKR